MSNYGWDDEIPEEETPKGLRKQLQDLAAKVAERDAVIAGLQREQRQRSMADALKDYGVVNPDKVSRLIPSDVADKPETLRAWLDDYKDVLAIRTSAPEAPADEPDAGAQTSADLPAEQIEAFQRLQTADASAGTTSPDLEAQHLAQLQAAYNAANGDADTYFAILRGEIQP